MSQLVQSMAEALTKEPMPTPRGGFFRVGQNIGKFTMNTNQQVENRVVKMSAWDEWKPPQAGMLRAIGRARLGALPWCLMAICHAWDERQERRRGAASLELVEATFVDQERGTLEHIVFAP